MAYFEPYIDSEGIHVPTYDDILEYLVAQYKGIFGEDVYLGIETPDYQLLSIFAKCLDDYSSLAIGAYNSRNPNYASGNSLDVIVQVAGMIRRMATRSTVVLTVSGAEGTVIPAGKKAIDKNGNLWTLDSSFTIPEEGEGTVSATCDTYGAVSAPIGSIDGIYTPVVGWGEVTNEEEAEVGKDTETDSELRERFFASHSMTENGLVDALVASLRRIGGVDFVSLVSNDTNSTSGGIPAHSMCAIVEGGDPDEIAKTLYNCKSPGTGTYGSVTKTVTDQFGNNHTVKFSRPTKVTVSVTINAIELDGYDDSVAEIIKQSIINDINSLGIGKSWNVTMGYKDIYSSFSGDTPVSVSSISAQNTHGTSTSTMTCEYDEILVTDEEHITIVTT